MKVDAIALTDTTPDTSNYATDGIELARNLVPTDGTWREVRGLETAGNTFPMHYQPGAVFSDPDGPIYAWALNTQTGLESKLFEWSTTGTVVDRSNGGSYAFGTTRCGFTKFGTTVIASPHSASIPLQGRIGSAATFTDLVTSPDAPRPKHVTTIGSFVVGANNQGGAGAYSSANSKQFMWCSRNNAAVWTPGVDRAGFASLQGEDNRELRGVYGFRDFGVLFEDYAVTRLSYTAGATVWDPQTIAAGKAGINFAGWEPSVVRVGRDLYYFSNSGPAVVVNGESVQSVGQGKVRRFMTDYLTEWSARQSGHITGIYEPILNLVIWTYIPNISYADEGQPAYYAFVYNIAEDRLSVVNADGLLGQRLDAEEAGGPLSRLRIFRFNNDTRVTSVLSMTDLSSSLVGAVTTKLWRPNPQGRVVLSHVRPIWRSQTASGVFGATTAPVLTITVQPADDPAYEVLLSAQNVDTSMIDSAGWIPIDPVSLVTAKFSVSVPSMWERTLEELTALELGYEIQSAY